MYVCIRVPEWSIQDNTAIQAVHILPHICTPVRAPLWGNIGVFTSIHSPAPGRGKRRTKRDPWAAPRPLTDPAPAQEAELREGANQSLVEHDRGEGLALGGRGWAWLYGAGLALPGLLLGVRRPKQTWRLFTFRPSSANGRAPCPRARPAVRSAEAAPKMAAARGGGAGAVL